MNPCDYTFRFGIGILSPSVMHLVSVPTIGAFLLGTNTTETIKGGIVQPFMYHDRSELLMLTMVCALIGSASCVLFASSKGLPISTTHAIVGAITGAGISAVGVKGVQWDGITKIVLS
ncbi:Na+/Pi symporter [Podila clonocystis]|nr:Na+/Pi symporter [Podila clonocystis]